MTTPANKECVHVVVRCRPLSSTEKQNQNAVIVQVEKPRKSIGVQQPGQSAPAQQWTFDSVWDGTTRQVDMYEDVCTPIVKSVLEGYNGTIFAYGQTGTGKTFTMEGVLDATSATTDLAGIMPRSFQQIFSTIAQAKVDEQYLVRASFLEIYNDDVLDLLSSDQSTKLDVKEHTDNGIYVKGLSQFTVKSTDELLQLLLNGKKNRKVGSTLMNRDSSRSHCIFTITVESSSMTSDDAQPQIRVGKLNLVDLAGSEKQSKTGAQGAQLKEATKINLSLSALGNVIAALTNPKAGHIPYRDSKLTRLLQDSLGGNTKTAMIANIGPADYNYEETISTLRFAARAKNIVNKPKINEDAKDTLLREYHEEIARLKAALAGEGGAGGDYSALGMTQSLMRGASSDASGATKYTLNDQGKFVVEKVVERVVIEGATPEQLRQIEEQQQLRLKQLEEQHQNETLTIAQQRTALEQQTSNLQQKVTQSVQISEQKRVERLRLQQQLQEMEAQLVAGKNAVQSMATNSVTIEQHKLALIKQSASENELKSQLREKEELQSTLQRQYESVEVELAAKNSKLEQLLEKHEQLKQDWQELQHSIASERNDALEQIRQLHQAISFKRTIIETFMHRVNLDDFEAQCVYNTEAGEDSWSEHYWQIKGTDVQVEMKRSLPLSVKYPQYFQQQLSQQRRKWLGPPPMAISDFTLQQRPIDTSSRYRDLNVIDLSLEVPERSTLDWMTEGDDEEQPVQEPEYAIDQNGREYFVDDRNGYKPAQSQYMQPHGYNPQQQAPMQQYGQAYNNRPASGRAPY